jgi:hypothetical protein
MQLVDYQLSMDFACFKLHTDAKFCSSSEIGLFIKNAKKLTAENVSIMEQLRIYDNHYWRKWFHEDIIVVGKT